MQRRKFRFPRVFLLHQNASLTLVKISWASQKPFATKVLERLAECSSMGSWDEIFIELLGSPGDQSHVYAPPPDKEVCSPFWGCILEANQALAEL